MRLRLNDDAAESMGASLQPDPLRVAGAGLLNFPFEGGETTIRVSTMDTCGADLVITHMTTRPDARKREGHGSAALRKLLDWAAGEGATSIKSVQVQEPSEGFWAANGFTSDPEPNPTNTYTHLKRVMQATHDPEEDTLLVGPKDAMVVEESGLHGLHLFVSRYGGERLDRIAFRLDQVSQLARAANPTGGKVTLSAIIAALHRRHPDIPEHLIREARRIAYGATNQELVIN